MKNIEPNEKSDKITIKKNMFVLKAKSNDQESSKKEDEIVIKTKPSNLYNRNNNPKNSTKTKFPVIAQKEIINESPIAIKNIDVETIREANSKKLENKILIGNLTEKMKNLEKENIEMNKVKIIFQLENKRIRKAKF